ncbi:MAG: DUF5696 domain-containing protein [Gemmatimonadota bacterium]
MAILGWAGPDWGAAALAALACVGMLAAAWPAQGAETDWGAPQVEVRRHQGRWIIAGARHTAELVEGSLELTVRDSAAVWRTEGSSDGDLTLLTPAPVVTRLAAARQSDYSEYRTGFLTGVAVELAGFPGPDGDLDVAITLFVGLEGEEEDLVCRVGAAEGQAAVGELRWPAPFVPASFDATVVPFMQGMLLPADWPRKVWLYDTLSYGRGLYMPWWGQQQGGAAVLILLETPADAGCHFAHPEGGPTRIGPRWVHSLGRLQYPRQLRLCFLRQGDYVDLAKRYRRHVKATGHLVSLREKIARSPLVQDLVGAPVVHTSILYHIEPASSYYRADDPAANHQLVRFEARAAQLRRLQARGVEGAYVHLDGWGFRGYDNLHPDILPPCPEAGGWAGMKELADTCLELGYVLALHDQYRDYYLDAPSYEPRHTILDAARQRPGGHTWYGGEQSILCASLAPGHVRRNHLALRQHGVAARGAYLDVFAVVPPDECYNPEHPVTRDQCLAFRGQCLDFIRSLGGVVSSEEPADWAIPHLDLVHHGPFALDPNPGSGPAMGIPVPLFSLVYHDALLLPWSLGRGAWGIPEKDLGYLHGLANAGLPYLSLEPGEAELEQVDTMRRLHRRVGLLEMTGHRFLAGGYRRQQTEFADGTRVTIDLDADTFAVEPGL